MTDHIIEENNEYYRFWDSQIGVNTRPVNGRYQTITDYRRYVDTYAPRGRVVIYDKDTQRYDSYVVSFGEVPYWAPGIEEWNVQKAKCLVKLHTAFDSVQLAKDLAEACTASCTFFSRVPRAIRYLKRGQFAKSYKTLAGVSKARQSIPNTWLQYQWAVKPLIGELEELWEKLQPKEAPVFKISSATGGKDQKSYIQKIMVEDAQDEFNVIWALKANRSVKAVRYFRHDILDSQGFHFNPLNAIWDGITWSFLVDWFIPVSDVLRGIAYSIPGCIGGFNNYREEFTSNIEGVYPYQSTDPSGRYSYHVEFPRTQYRSFAFEREIDTSITLTAADINALLLSSPAGLTLKRTLNLFAIAWKAAS
jgi:hypothetical protein